MVSRASYAEFSVPPVSHAWDRGLDSVGSLGEVLGPQQEDCLTQKSEIQGSLLLPY
jgi:hypothetical protein